MATNRKVDRRTIISEKLIRDAFFECLNEKGTLEEVFVKDICKLAGLNRSTFYKHYKNCPDLLEQLANEESQEMKDIFSGSEELFSRENAVKMAAVLERNADLNTAYANGLIGDGLENKIMDAIREICLSSWKKPLTKSKKKKAEMISSAAAAAFVELLIINPGKYTVKDTFALLSGMLESAM